jgi:hypothetical protein
MSALVTMTLIERPICIFCRRKRLATHVVRITYTYSFSAATGQIEACKEHALAIRTQWNAVLRGNK